MNPAAQLLPSAPAGPGSYRPHTRLPTQQSLTYAKLALELLLIILAIPWLLKHLGKHPPPGVVK